jgi:multidrug transporter EmrE-like cation transporter
MAKILMIIADIVFAAGGNLLLKHGMNAAGSVADTHLPLSQYALQALTRPQIIVGVILYIVSFVMWLALLSMMDISLVYPIFVSAAFIIVMVGSVFLFGEHVTPLRVLGTAVVALGIALVSVSK